MLQLVAHIERAGRNIPSKCQGKGMLTKTKPMKANIEKTQFGGSPGNVGAVKSIVE
jgi:hypothetical protein